MAFPPIYEDLFQNEGEGPKLRPDILPEIKLGGDTSGSVHLNEDGDYEIDVTTEATQLKEAHTILTDLESTTAASFDGTKDIQPGVTGILPKTSGGTGNNSGLAATATALATGRTIRTNLASTSAVTFDGTANVTPGVTGVLPTTYGGTGNANGTVAKWTTARTITLSGAVTSSAVSIDGSANITISTSASTSSGISLSDWGTSTGSSTVATKSVGTSYTAGSDGFVVVSGASWWGPMGVTVTVGKYSHYQASSYQWYTQMSDTCCYPVKKGTTYSTKSYAWGGDCSVVYFVSVTS